MERYLNQSGELLQPLSVNAEMLEYLAGFFDVSGSVSIERRRDYRIRGRERYNYVLRAELERVQPTAIDAFKTILPGYEGNRDLPSGKVTNRWYVKARKARLLLETLGPHFRLKAGHCEVIQEFINTIGQRTAEESEELKVQLMELNKNPKPSLTNPLTEPYLAGVFDGHGSVGIYDYEHARHMSLQIKIQLDHQALMSKIGRTLETNVFQNTSHGTVVAYVASLNSGQAAAFLERMQPYSIRHREIIPLALSFQALWELGKGRRRTEEQYTKLIEAKNLLNQAKR